MKVNIKISYLIFHGESQGSRKKGIVIKVKQLFEHLPVTLNLLDWDPSLGNKEEVIKYLKRIFLF